MSRAEPSHEAKDPIPVAALLAVPVVSSISPSSGSTGGGSAVTVTGSGFSGATQVRFGATPAGSFTVNSDTRITAVSPAGSGTVGVTVTTPGGISSQFVPYTYVAVAAPVLNSLNPSSGPPTGGTTVTLTGTGLSGATAVTFGTTAAPSFTVVSPTRITAVSPAGSGTVGVTVTTPGGVSAQFVPYTYVAVATPVLNSLNPSSGPPTGGTTVTLTGTGLSGATAVTFGTTAAPSFTVVSPTQITATAPPGTGTVQVTATTPGGTSNGLSYTYVAAPGLTTIAPAQGPATGNTTVTLTGSGFTGATQVNFGAVPATSFTVISDTQITAVAPAACPGAAAVTVTTPAGTTPPTVFYFYRGTPAVTQISPDTGPVSGGTTVTLTGSNLLGATAVRFGATSAPSFTVVSDTQVTATAPASSAGAVAVTAITPGGTSTPTVTYTYAAVPSLTSLAPPSGPATGGNTVTLIGTGLTLAQSVTIGGAPAAFTVVSDTYVTAIAPPGPAGSSTVAVTTPGGTATRTYTRVAPPTV
ncbi:IPT/TIG domain-containing protein [Streptomyces sp. NPDC051776]|uniref:IPT/TIG domain-containing protein n=1 Tax=Streptomyces sp. NPDC051776 TaxID=3155414 RepID=UPI003426636D